MRAPLATASVVWPRRLGLSPVPGVTAIKSYLGRVSIVFTEIEVELELVSLDDD